MAFPKEHGFSGSVQFLRMKLYTKEKRGITAAFLQKASLAPQLQTDVFNSLCSPSKIVSAEPVQLYTGNFYFKFNRNLIERRAASGTKIKYVLTDGKNMSP